MITMINSQYHTQSVLTLNASIFLQQDMDNIPIHSL